jgi:hypothetical protein
MTNNNRGWIEHTTKEQRLAELIDMMNRFAAGYAQDAERAAHLAEGYDVDREDENLDERERRACAYEAGQQWQLATDLRHRSEELSHFAEMLTTCQ